MRMALRMAMPVTPVLSLTTCGSVIFICVRAFCLCWIGGLAYVTSLARCRRELRSTHPGSAGRKAAANRP